MFARRRGFGATSRLRSRGNFNISIWFIWPKAPWKRDSSAPDAERVHALPRFDWSDINNFPRQGQRQGRVLDSGGYGDVPKAAGIAGLAGLDVYFLGFAVDQSPRNEKWD